MLRVRYSIVCDYCGKVFCDDLMGRRDFENYELQSKFQEARNRGWGIAPGGDSSAHVLCNECRKQGITCLDICDKMSNPADEDWGNNQND